MEFLPLTVILVGAIDVCISRLWSNGIRERGRVSTYMKEGAREAQLIRSLINNQVFRMNEPLAS